MKQRVLHGILALLPLLSLPVSASAGEADGVLQWRQKTELSLPVSGVVDSVRVERGQSVKRGQVMLTLDKRPFASRLESAKARMAQTEPGRREAQNELSRAEELFDRTVLSQVELDRAQMAFDEKNAIHGAARAETALAEMELEYSALKAPFDLVVLQTHVARGQTVINELRATPLFTVATGELMVTLHLPPTQAAGLDIGVAVNVVIDGDARQNRQGTVSALDYDAATRAVQAAVRLASQPDAAVGRPARVTWP